MLSFRREFRRWPEDSLEKVESCPVCCSKNSCVTLENLSDNVFFVAPGDWALWQCLECKSAYLNPRPDPKSIGCAYGEYYTHESQVAEVTPYKDLAKLRKLRRALANAYVNYRYGTERAPENKFGIFLGMLFPKYTQPIDRQFRFLPKPKPGQRLLDVGCGNGDFMSVAVEAGWDVTGVDPDPKALAVASGHGFDVREGGVEVFQDDKNLFDVITISHVIEHVHSPKKLMEMAYNLLKPGGLLYLETPNIESRGFEEFKESWRGLEVPRHLVLFSARGLERLLTDIGFSVQKFYKLSSVCRDLFIRSFRIRKGHCPYDSSIKSLPLSLNLKLLIPERTSNSEFISLMAVKPKE